MVPSLEQENLRNDTSDQTKNESACDEHFVRLLGELKRVAESRYGPSNDIDGDEAEDIWLKKLVAALHEDTASFSKPNCLSPRSKGE